MRLLVLPWLLALPVLAQQPHIGAPPAADPIERGRAAYRSNCAFCHGLTGKGGRGPDLTTQTKVHGGDEASIAKIIREGVAGSNMPGFPNFEPEDLRALVLFVQNLSAASAAAAAGPALGDAAEGQKVYAKNRCESCHRIGQEGSVYGPDLTRIGASRSLEYLRESIVNPNADIPAEQRGVVVTLANGSKVSGVRINEDSFSVQLRDIGQKYRSYWKQDVKSVEEAANSLMPAYARMPKTELDHLLAYLLTLKGDNTAGKTAGTAKGIH
ncbi:MAG: hypothetical protein OHK0021_10050 [Bryobacter sp.]